MCERPKTRLFSMVTACSAQSRLKQRLNYKMTLRRPSVNVHAKPTHTFDLVATLTLMIRPNMSSTHHWYSLTFDTGYFKPFRRYGPLVLFIYDLKATLTLITDTTQRVKFYCVKKVQATVVKANIIIVWPILEILSLATPINMKWLLYIQPRLKQTQPQFITTTIFLKMNLNVKYIIHYMHLT